MEEALRAQPAVAIPMVLYGPMLRRLYFRVKTQLDLLRGELRVETGVPGALVFVSGRSAGVSPVTVKGLYHGAHDVLVIRGQRTSRVRRVAVGARRKVVRFDLDLDRAVHTRDFAGLLLPEGAGRQGLESRLAQGVGERLGAERVLLVGVRRVGRRKVILGQVFLVRQRAYVAKAYVVMSRDGPSLRALNRLARFLMYGAKPGRGVVVVGRPRPAGAGRVASLRRRSSAFAIAGWTALSVGLATGLAGGVLLGLDGTRTESDDPLHKWAMYDTAKPGYGLLAAGLGIAVVGAALLISDRVRRRSAKSAMPSNAPVWRLAFTAGGGMLLGVDGRF